MRRAFSWTAAQPPQLQTPDTDDRTPLHAAATAPRDAEALCRLLLRAGANAAACDSSGKTPAGLAHDEAMRALLSRDAAAMAEEDSLVAHCAGLSAPEAEWLHCSPLLGGAVARMTKVDLALRKDVLTPAEHAAQAGTALDALAAAAREGFAKHAAAETRACGEFAAAKALLEQELVERRKVDADAEALRSKLGDLTTFLLDDILDAGSAARKATAACAASGPAATALLRLHAWELFDTLLPADVDVAGALPRAAAAPLAEGGVMPQLAMLPEAQRAPLLESLQRELADAGLRQPNE